MSEQEYAVTQTQIARFRLALDTAAPAEGVHPDLLKAEKAAIKSVLEELVAEARAWEAATGRG